MADVTVVHPADRSVLERGSPAEAHIVHRVFDTIAAMNGVASLYELNDLFRPIVRELGFSLFAGTKFVKPDGMLWLKPLFGEGYERWFTQYLKMDRTARDGVLRECFSTSQPFYWNDLAGEDRFPDDAASVIRKAKEHGLCQGLAVPLRQPDTSILIVLLAGESFDVDNPFARALAYLLASHYGIAGSHLYSGLSNGANPEEERLTTRQRQCLKWVKLGKSSTDIAGILAISAYVVDEHIANACKRLGVRTRAQAVLAASSRGLLDLDV